MYVHLNFWVSIDAQQAFWPLVNANVVTVGGIDAVGRLRSMITGLRTLLVI